MLQACRVPPNRPTSNKSEHHLVAVSGSSETERIASAQAAASALMTRKRNKLADYINGKYAPPRGVVPLIDEIVAAYLMDHAEHSRSRQFLHDTASRS